MSKKVNHLEKIRRDLAMLSDDLTYKLDDLVLGLGNLIEIENKTDIDFLEKIKKMKADRRKLLAFYINAIEQCNMDQIDSAEEIWSLEGRDFKFALQELEEFLDEE